MTTTMSIGWNLWLDLAAKPDSDRTVVATLFERTNVTWREQRRRLVENCTHLWLGLVAKPNGDNWLLYWLEQMSRDDHGRRWLVECCKHLWLGLAAKPNGDNGEDGGGAQLGPRRRLLTLLSLHLDIKLNIIDNYSFTTQNKLSSFYKTCVWFGV